MNTLRTLSATALVALALAASLWSIAPAATPANDSEPHIRPVLLKGK